MKKDVFKSLGITVGEPNLLRSESQFTIAKGDNEQGQSVRKGLSGNAREQLDGQISKGMIFALAMQEPSQYAKPLDKAGEAEMKGMHGEMHHSDANKMDDYKIEEVDHSHAQDDIEFPMHRYTNNVKPNAGAKQAQKSLRPEALVLKALTDLDRPNSWIKSEKAAAKNEIYEMEIKEHKTKDPKKLVQAEKKEHTAKSLDPMDTMYKSLKKGLKKPSLRKSDDLIEMSEDSNDPDVIANVHENSDHVVEKKKSDPLPPPPPSGPNLNPAGVASMKNAFKSELGELATLVKGNTIEPIVQRAPAAPRPVSPANRGFLKAMGPGGAVFDFGPKTGNDMADRATELLNMHGDPVQFETAKYQAESYNQALADYAVKGDAAYNNTTTMFGNIDKGWSNQLNKPMDQQVAEMYKAEQEAKDPSIPFLKNEFNKTELNVNGEIIKATSETDAAVLEMYKAMNTSGIETGDVADCSTGGAIKVIAGE